MKNRLTIYSLAERDIVLHAIWNHLGWAPEATRGFPPLSGPPPQVNHEELTFDKVKQAGAVLVIKHLFKPFKKPKPEYYMRGYYDAAFRLLKLLLRKEVPFILDIVNEDDFREETDILRRCSPPLYNKLFPRKEQ